MDGRLLIEKLLAYAKAHLSLREEDEVYMRNVLLSQFGFTEPYEGDADVSAEVSTDVPDALAEELKAFALEKGLCEEDFAERYVADVFGLLSPLPSEVNRTFGEIKSEKGAQAACDYLYNISVKNGYYKAATYPEIWSRISVEYILSNYEYTGSTVNFKTKRKSFKNKKQVIQGREDWAVFEGTQEAIIDKETFETVQKMRGTKRAYTKFNEVNIFSGLLYCADCGGKMTIRRRKADRRKDAFICSTYRKKKKNLCTEHAIKVSALEQIVLADIRKVCAYVRQYEEEFVEDFRQCSAKESARLQSSARNELKKTENRLSEIEKIIVKH